jgi:uroporphyrin-III C-methyltransferase
MTLAGFDLLAGADYVFHDALVAPDVLALAGPGAQLVDVGKRAGQENPNQEDITRRMVDLACQGQEVVRLKGGDPFVFGRGGEELTELVAAGLEVVVVPGVTAAVAAPGLAGIPLTLRGVSSSVAFVTGQGRDGLPPGALEKVAAACDTLVVLMALGRLEEIAVRLSSVLGDEWPAAVVASAGLPAQAAVRGCLASIASRSKAAGLGPPATLIVGRVVEAVPVCGQGADEISA